MKKILILFLSFALISCTDTSWKEISQNEIKDISQVLTNDNIEKNDLKVYIDYPIFTNTWTNIIIKSWFDSFIKNIKNSLQETQLWKIYYSFEKELHASFQEFGSNWTKSIYYEIFENLWWAHPMTYIKIFNFDQEWNLLSQDQVFSLDDEKKKNLKQIIVKKLDSEKIDYFKDSLTDFDWFDEFFLNMNFYLDNEEIFFIFEQYQIAPYSSWLIKINFTKSELKEFLNTEFLSKNQEIEKISEENINSVEKNIIKNEVWADFDPEKKYIALTFDDWPNKKYTPKLLDILKENNVHATFFVLWKNADYFDEIIKRQFEEWHEIWVHSRDHPKLTRLDDESLRKQLYNTREKIFEITWVYTDLMRPTYWLFNDKVKNIWWKTIVLWSVDSNDWKYRNVSKNVAQVINTTRNWSIILMHDIHKESINSVDKIIKNLKQSWYEFVTVSELLSIYQGSTDLQNKVCSSGPNCK